MIGLRGHACIFYHTGAFIGGSYLCLAVTEDGAGLEE